MSEGELRQALQAAVDEAFEQFGTVALWSKRRPAVIEAGTGHAVWPTLLREGPFAARALALRIKELSHALDRVAAARGEAARRAS